jgi:RNA polymerase sigma-70 factor (ECF subfamily)
MDQRADCELIGGSIADPALFEVVFARHFGPVHRYLRRRVGEELAGELASETFLRAFRARASLDTDRRSALPWLYAIAANLMLMHHRTEERRLRAYARAANDRSENWLASGPQADQIDARLDAIALRPALADALAELTVPLREVLLLHAWAGLSNEEVADALGCSVGAVRTRLSRARDQVERQLSERQETVQR